MAKTVLIEVLKRRKNQIGVKYLIEDDGTGTPDLDHTTLNAVFSDLK